MGATVVCSVKHLYISILLYLYEGISETCELLVLMCFILAILFDELGLCRSMYLFC